MIENRGHHVAYGAGGARCGPGHARARGAHRPVAVASPHPVRFISGGRLRCGGEAGRTNPAARADDLVGRVDRRRRDVRTKPVQPDGAGLWHAPQRRRAGRLRARAEAGCGRGRDLQGGARARRAMPGVESATVYQPVPFTGFHVPPIGVPGMAESPSVDGQLPFLIAATPEFLDILGIDILQGRRFTADDERGAPVVIVNQTMARSVWPGERARQVHPDRIRSVVRSLHGGRPARAAHNGAVPRGRRRRPRRPSTVGCPGGAEDRLMQYLVPFSQVPGPPAVSRRPGIQGLLVRTSVAAEDSLAHSSRGRRWPHRSAVCRGASVLDLLARQMRPWRWVRRCCHLWGPGADRRRDRSLRRVCPRDSRNGAAKWRSASRSAPCRVVLGMILREAALPPSACCAAVRSRSWPAGGCNRCSSGLPGRSARARGRGRPDAAVAGWRRSFPPAPRHAPIRLIFSGRSERSLTRSPVSAAPRLHMNGEREREGGALVRVPLDADGSIVGIHDGLANCEAEAHPVRFRRVERLEHPRQLLVCQADAKVATETVIWPSAARSQADAMSERIRGRAPRTRSAAG